MSTNYAEGTEPALMRTYDIRKDIVAQLYTRDLATHGCGALPFVDNL